MAAKKLKDGLALKHNRRRLFIFPLLCPAATSLDRFRISPKPVCLRHDPDPKVTKQRSFEIEAYSEKPPGAETNLECIPLPRPS
jgi:hypothetical protein